MRRNVAACGTAGGWKRHHVAGQAPCEACRLAINAYQEKWRASRDDSFATWAALRVAAGYPRALAVRN